MEKKVQICRYAAEVFAKEGFHDTKVQEIADAAGIAVGTVYNYFSSKDEILEYIFEEENHKRIDFLLKLKNSPKTNLDKILDFCDFHIYSMREDPSIGKVLVQELLVRKGDKSSSVRKELKILGNIIRDMLEDAVRDGETRDINTGIAARIILDILRGIVLQVQYEGTDEEFEILRKELKTFVKCAIKKS